LHKLGQPQYVLTEFDTAMRGGWGDDANWHTIESKPVQQAIRALGHDSFWVKEGGVKNLGVYNPGAIKSAIGNRGTYDTEDYDVNKAQGGAVHLKGGKSVGQMSAEMREKGRQAFLEPSKVKDVLYHGSLNDINEFKPGAKGLLGPGVYLTPHPGTAGGYASFRGRIKGDATGANVVPVHAQIKNPYYFDNDPLVPMTGEHVERLKALGHDAAILRDTEGNINQVNVFHPHQIKSAIGNRGTYDTTNPDITKAQGGAVKPVKLKEGQQPPYQDPKTSKIDDWKWHPMERIRQELSARRELPEHVTPYADYMREMNAKAQAGELTPRDLVKAYTITQSSIGRGGLSHSTATKRGMKLPNTGGEVRPEGAFAEWLGSPMGQKYLEASMRGEEHPEAMEDLRAKFAPFGKQNAQVEAMQYATQNAPSLGERLNKAITGSKADYRKYAGGIKGIAGAKSGFIGSLLGRGDLPTLDARQLNLHSLSHPTKTPEGMMSRGKGLGGQEAVDRLIARQDALGYKIPKELAPYAQHLIHHDVWDQRGGTKTTHEDLIKAMRGYADGGDVEQMRHALMVKHLAGGTKQPKAVLLPQSDPEYQRIMDKWRSGKKLSAAENVNLGISHPVSAVKLRAPIGTLGYKERADPSQPVSPEKFITPENLQGGAGIPLIGDMARLGELTHVGDEELPTPVRMQAGAHHMRKIKPPGESSIWASAPGVISRQSKLVKTAIGMPGVDKVYGLHASMLPTGVDFGKPLSKTLVGQLQNNPPHPEVGNAFNEVMRKKYPEFAGVENPAELHEQLMADTRRAPGMRKTFVKLMDSAPYQNAGMPSVGHARVAISDPEQLNLPVHSIGMGIGEYEPTGRIIRKATMPHEDYSAESAGKHTGRFEVPMSRGEMFPEWEAKRRELNMSTSADPRSFSMSMPIQKYDQEWVDKVMPLYLAKRKAILGRAKGGSVSMDEMLAHTTLGKKAPNVRNIGADEAPDMKVKQYISPGPGKGIDLPAGGVDFQPEMPGHQLTQAAPAGPAMPGMPPGMPGMPGMPPGMPPGGPGMPPGGPGPGMPGMPPPLPRNQPGMPTGKPAGLEPPNIPPPKQKPSGSNILSMTPQGQALAALGPMRKMADGGSVEQMKRELAKKKDQPIVASRAFQEAPEPTKTTKAYKLFRTHPKHPGKLFPLFVDANEPIEQGKWLAAQAGEMAGEKVKSKIGPLAYRPGWHAGDLPIATHIGGKSTPELKKPDVRPDNHVWAEVEMPNDVDWHSEAQRRGTNDKGRVVPVKAHITDQVPTGGHYRYKTNPNMTGNWLIGGSMKVNRVLPDKEVAAINRAAGVADLPRQQPQDLGKLGFGVVKKAEGGAIDYRGEHAAPGPESGKPMHDTTGVYPPDFYGPRGFEYYANTHQPYDRASYNTVAAAKGVPDKMVWAHRAVPKDVYNAAMKTSEPTAHMIRPGDWVTPSREYAKEHGEGLGEGYHIARKRVPAKHLYTNADSIHEWGYHPEPMQKKREGGVTLPPSTEQMRQALSARRSNSKA